MKFSCPSCQAKYQLADEKVAGRTVKMKCRKCGTVVPVNADGVVSDSMLAANAPMVSLAPAPPSVAAAPRPAVPRAAPAAAPGPPRAGGLTPSPAPAQAAKAPVPQRRASAGVAKPAANIIVAEAPVPPTASRDDDVAGPPSMRRLASRAPIAVAEWFAGIDGSPVGPMTRDELKAKVEAGKIQRETLIWRDGMSGWVPFVEVPDVADLLVIREAPAPAPPAAFIAPAPAATTGLNFEKSTELEASFFSGQSPAAAVPNPKIAAAIAPSPTITQLGGTSASTATIQLPEPDFGLPHAPTSSTPPRPSMFMRARSHITKTHVGIAVGFALLFGLMMGFVFFGGKGQTKIIKQIVEVPVEAKPATAAVTEQPTAVAEVGVAPVPTAAPKGSGSSGAVGGTAQPGKPSTETGGGLKGLSGLGDLGPTGPNAGSGSGTNSGNNGQPLEASQIQSTVSRYQSGVKRGCWEPALSSRDKDAPSSARVTVSINVSSSGTVQSASGSGDPRGYRGLSSCIERRVLAWQFPRSSGATTVKVPFVFAAQ